MGRSRLLVALVPPAELLADVQALRRSMGDARVDALAPHITLVPPLNVASDQLPAARAVLRAAAAPQRPFELSLGPAATFAPASATVHLSVGGALEQLGELRRRLQADPLDRPDPRPFVPHVTLRNRVADELLAAAVELHGGALGVWAVDRVTMLEQVTHHGVGTRWEPVFEVPFGAPATVGRGGLELQFRTVGIVEPQAAALLGGEPEPPGVTRGALLVTVASTAADPDRCIAAVRGRADPASATIEQIVVSESWRGLGVGSHLLAQWNSAAASTGCSVALAQREQLDVAVRQLLVSRGFTDVAGVLVRRL